MYSLIFTKSFEESYSLLTKKDSLLIKRLDKTLHLLMINPHYPALKSHKVGTRNHGQKWSSQITGDLRLIWDYIENNSLSIIILDIESHSGSKRVYK